jgi:PilZ domain
MSEETRRSERVWTELPVRISGDDGSGRAFVEQARTQAVGRNGATLLVTRKLFPNQELAMRCLKTGKECEARVVGSIRQGLGHEESCYGVELVKADEDLWGIEFPPVEESEEAVGRILLQCGVCKSQEVTYLSDFELEVLEANEALNRECDRCGISTRWKKLTSQEPLPEKPKPAPATKENRRREPRRPIKVSACVRCHQFDNDELVTTENVSRGGLCFTSPRIYAPGWDIEVAVPYSPGGGNIFLRGKIVRVQYLAPHKTKLYGVSYTHVRG